jgi:putative NIF3 family GTP cyclohydrolase 1 type 2
MNKPYSQSRRSFLATTAGLVVLPSTTGQSKITLPSSSAMTIQQVIDLILKEIPGAPFSSTVDTIKSGNGEQVVTGIVTTMFATVDVIRKAVALGANFIIAHEPTFYSHSDETTWLANDPVYTFKRDLLNKHKIVLWRFHDYWHSHRPDGVLMGVLEKLGLKEYYQPENPSLIIHPGIAMGQLAAVAKKSLGIGMVRIIGDQKQVCKRIALIPGAAGGTTQIKLLGKEQPDVLVVGEVHEWETAEYVRDAQAMGRSMSLIVLGHAQSEEPGMEWLVSWLTPKLNSTTVTHIPSHNPFTNV